MDLTYKNVLFDKNSTSVVSPVFYIFPGYVSIISLFGMHQAFKGFDDGKAYSVACMVVQKVVVADSVLPQISAGCGGASLESTIAAIPKNAVIRFEDVMQACDQWSINPCSNFAVITVPGAYQLKVADDAQLGEFYVEQLTTKAEHAVMIPAGLILGN